MRELRTCRKFDRCEAKRDNKCKTNEITRIMKAGRLQRDIFGLFGLGLLKKPDGGILAVISLKYRTGIQGNWLQASLKSLDFNQYF